MKQVWLGEGFQVPVALAVNPTLDAGIYELTARKHIHTRALTSEASHCGSSWPGLNGSPLLRHSTVAGRHTSVGVRLCVCVFTGWPAMLPICYAPSVCETWTLFRAPQYHALPMSEGCAPGPTYPWSSKARFLEAVLPAGSKQNSKQARFSPGPKIWLHTRTLSRPTATAHSPDVKS